MTQKGLLLEQHRALAKMLLALDDDLHDHAVALGNSYPWKSRIRRSAWRLKDLVRLLRWDLEDKFQVEYPGEHFNFYHRRDPGREDAADPDLAPIDAVEHLEAEIAKLGRSSQLGLFVRLGQKLRMRKADLDVL